jgi:antitoxin (DNA-binding transcriptional repressor) of toxin-antitoxin stability system
MAAIANYGLEQARIQLPSIAANAYAGVCSIITKHGKPYAAIVPVQALQKPATDTEVAPGILALQGTGRGLWGADVGHTVAELRAEWDVV